MVEQLPYNEILASASAIGIIILGVSKSLRKEVIKRQGGACFHCKVLAKNQLEMHHKVPKMYGGRDHPDNIVGLCGEGFNDCHDFWDEFALKHATLPDGTPLDFPVK